MKWRNDRSAYLYCG